MKSLYDLEEAFARGLEAWEGKIAKQQAGKMGQKIVREVKRLTPVDTGNLRRRWISGVEGEGSEILIRVENDAEYAAPVNNGHRIVRNGKTVGMAQPVHMLERGIETYQAVYMQEDMEEMIQKLREAVR